MGTKTSRHSLQLEMGQTHTYRQKPCAETEEQGRRSMRAGQAWKGSTLEQESSPLGGRSELEPMSLLPASHVSSNNPC